MLSEEQLEKIANQEPVDIGGAQNPIVTEMAAELLSLREQLAELKALPPVAWHTEDHDTDKSATTYNQEVAEQWKYKGWPVTELFTAAKPVED